MGCGLPCEQEESYPGEQISNSSEDEFQVLSIGRYQMTVDNPKDMENPWRYEIDLFPIYIIKYKFTWDALNGVEIYDNHDC